MTDHPDEGVGYLTWEEFERFRNAVNKARYLVPWLRIAGYIRSGDPDELRHRSSDLPLGLPPTWIAAEEITNLLNEINQWPELEDVAVHGSEFALTLTREVETADAKWPMEDRAHKVTYLRCASCDQLTLRYHPPKHPGDDIAVRCRAKECRAVMDGALLAFAVTLIESENNARNTG